MTPSEFTPPMKAALALLTQGDFEAALSLLKQAISQDQDEPKLHNIIGSVWVAMGQKTKAIAAIERAISLDPDYASAHHNLGLLKLQDGDVDAAIDHFENATRIDPDDSSLSNSLAAAQFAARRPHDALHTVQDALSAAPDDLDLKKSEAEYLLSCHRLDDAFERFATLIQADPDDGQLHLSMARAQSLLGHASDAAATLKTAARLMPQNHEVYLQLGRLWLQAKHPIRAREAFEHAAKLAPDQAVIYRDLGKAELALSKTEKALRHYQRSLSIDPANPETRHFINALSGQTTSRPPAAYVTNLFDAYADSFETSLLSELDYKAFAAAAKLALTHASAARFSSVLDLGCGTGLFGVEIREHCARLAGVDLSSRMISRAANLGIYDALDTGDIVQKIATDGAVHDLYAATDVFVYLGDLLPVFQAFRDTAPRGAMLVFTTEEHSGDGFELRASGRFAHSQAYLATSLQSLGLTMAHYSSLALRREGNAHLTGGLCLVRNS